MTTWAEQVFQSPTMEHLRNAQSILGGLDPAPEGGSEETEYVDRLMYAIGHVETSLTIADPRPG